MTTTNKILITAIALAALGGTTLFVQANQQDIGGRRAGPAPASMSESAKTSSPKEDVKIPLTVFVTSPQDAQVPIIGRGVAEPHFDLTMISEVSGKITWLSDKFESGYTIKKGEVIAQVEAIDYEQALSEAKEALAEANLNYLEEERQGEQARLEWERSGIKSKPASPLVLREPQMEQVKLALEQAKNAVKSAQKDLDNTKIKAPFDALVVTRSIDVGTYLQAGSEIGEVNSIDRMEFSIPLSKQQWKLVPNLSNEKLQESRIPVKLTDTTSDQNWEGYISRIERHIDDTSRQRSLVVAVDRPIEKELYSGTFISANITGKVLKNVLKLPQSAVSSENTIYYVEDGRLQVKDTFVTIASDSEHVYIAPWTDKEVQVVTYPIAIYKNNVGQLAEIKSVVTE